MKDIKVLVDTLAEMEFSATGDQIACAEDLMKENADKILLLAQESGFATAEEPLTLEEVVALSAYLGLEMARDRASLGILRKVKEAIEIH